MQQETAHATTKARKSVAVSVAQISVGLVKAARY